MIVLSPEILKDLDSPDIDRTYCKRRFFNFVKYFWSTIIAEEPVWNWHIPYLCDELEQVGRRVAERKHKEYDYIIINISPGSSKSTIVSIMYPLWCWVIDPTQRFICGSYASTVSEDIAEKCFNIYTSDLFNDLFPELVRHRSGGKTHFANGLRGERYTTSTGSMIQGVHAHQKICLPYEQVIYTEDGWLKIGDIFNRKIDVKVLTYNELEKKCELKRITKFEKNEGRRLLEIQTKSGRSFRCTEDHLVFTHNRGYVEAKNLNTDDIIEVI